MARPPTRSKEEEREFVDGLIRNFWEHPRWCTECLTIPDKYGNVVRFDQTPAQLKLHQVMKQQQERRRPVRIIYLKARQVHVSAGVAGQFFHHTPFTPGQKALVVAHDKESTQEIFGYYEWFQEHYKAFQGLLELPGRKATRTGHLLRWKNGSYVKVATANNLKGGRSHSLRFLHLSEFAFWRDAKTLMAALMNAVPDDPDTMVVIESTANGVGGEFWNLWQRACDPNNKNKEWIPIFFGCQEHPEYVRPLEMPRDRFERSLNEEEIDLMQNWQASLEFLNWRRWAIENKCQGSVELFHQEFPTRPEEAFLTTGRPRFSHVALSRMPIIHDAMVGELEQFQSGVKTITQFVPKERGALVMYKRPQERHQYVIGADAAEGIDVGEGVLGAEDPDWSVGWVVDRDSGEQVAKLRARLEPAPFGQYLVVLGAWYNWAFLVPETTGPGLALIEELLRQDYPPSLIYHRQPQADERFVDDQSTLLQHLGFRTNSVSRVQLISKFDTAIREMSIIIRDPNSLQECRTFVIKPNGKAEHQDNCHDDEVFAGALSVEGLLHPPPDRRLAGLDRRPPGLTTAGAVAKYGKRRLLKAALRGIRVRV